MHKTTLFKLLAVCWTGLITGLSLANMGSLGGSIPIPNKDKLVHFTFYFVFVYLWGRSYPVQTKQKLLLVFGIAIFYGISIEFIQNTCTASRTADVWDVVANSLGAYFSFYLLNKNIQKTTQ